MYSRLTTLFVLFLLFVACGQPDAPETTEPPEPIAPVTLTGTWRAVLASPGGELPFTLRIEEGAVGLKAAVVNGAESTELSSVELLESEIVLRFDWYDAEITAEISEDGQSLEGRWRKTVPDGDSVLPFKATLDDERRFLPLDEAGLEAGAEGLPDVSGVWAVEFREQREDEEEAAEETPPELAQGEFQQEGDKVTGTFLTATGDYRFLEGRYEQGRLRLSTFDGAHAFLFDARAQEDGTLQGDFWSRDSYHATWTARPAEEDENLVPDAWTQVGLGSDGSFDFTFPNLDGEEVSIDDPQFQGKVVVVNIFGSWCPNCNDEAPLLGKWHEEYRDQGFEIIGLAYELTGEEERDAQQVRRFAKRYNLEYPMLLAGTSDKSKASKTLPALSSILAFPTTVILDRSGTVRSIHSGFSGPGTGEHYDRLVEKMETLIEGLLEEPAPETEEPAEGQTGEESAGATKEAAAS
jgi:thiol-disulfide isomerase/thioredoxin